MNEDFIPHFPHPTQQETRATSVDKKWWTVLQYKLGGLRIEQSRKYTVMDNMQAMMQHYGQRLIHV